MLDEIDETFIVNLTSPTNATIADGQGIGTITDDDAAPTLSINDVTVTEGNAGTTNATFTVTPVRRQRPDGHGRLRHRRRQPPSRRATTRPSAATLTFAPGETTQTVTVQVNGDMLDEIDETFLVNLTSPTNATIVDGQGIGTITDDDAPPTSRSTT